MLRKSTGSRGEGHRFRLNSRNRSSPAESRPTIRCPPAVTWQLVRANACGTAAPGKPTITHAAGDGDAVLALLPVRPVPGVARPVVPAARRRATIWSADHPRAPSQDQRLHDAEAWVARSASRGRRRVPAPGAGRPGGRRQSARPLKFLRPLDRLRTPHHGVDRNRRIPPQLGPPPRKSTPGVGHGQLVGGRPHPFRTGLTPSPLEQDLFTHAQPQDSHGSRWHRYHDGLAHPVRRTRDRQQWPPPLPRTWPVLSPATDPTPVFRPGGLPEVPELHVAGSWSPARADRRALRLESPSARGARAAPRTAPLRSRPGPCHTLERGFVGPRAAPPGAASGNVRPVMGSWQGFGLASSTDALRVRAQPKEPSQPGAGVRARPARGPAEKALRDHRRVRQ
ncbi:hypothetical protein SAMN05216371_0268 [Streptomyces sp. TLI_053]|nr:hypothetical protein SAMN05216371_0268 [Streptomyces sp. TLI_053]